VWDRHAARKGFRLARAYDGDVLVGFGYGYTGESGQWWTDHARMVLAPDVAATWLGGHFELVSIGLSHERLLLMTTSDPSDVARRLYASEGWRVLGPGIAEATVIMGKHVVPAGA
jgi:hypothetical protein